MVKKHKILESYQVFLYCDKCGERMNYIKFSNGYNYSCPNCGNKVISENSYPHQIVNYELDGEVIDEGD